MKTAIIIYCNEHGAPTGYNLVCAETQEKALQSMARHLILAAAEGPHVCKCGGKIAEKTD